MEFAIKNGLLTGYSGSDAEARIPEGVTEIGTFSLACCGMTRISFPKSLRIIGKHAFIGCANLEEIQIPEGVESIGEGAFLDCKSLARVTLPNSLRHMDAAAFHSSGLTELIIGERAGEIGICAMDFCENFRVIKMRPEDPEFVRRYRETMLSEGLMHVWEMHLSGDYSGDADETIKYPVLMLDYLHTHDEKLTDYIRKHLYRIMQECVPAGDMNMIQVLMQSGTFFTVRNIDACIALAQDCGQNEILMMLMNYKNAHIGFADKGIRL